MDIYFLYSGLLATIWIVLGVIIASHFYRGYSHKHQFCSELGATGSPTEKLSPLINNYPLGALFCLSGWSIWQSAPSSWTMVAIGVLIIGHGIGTWIAGFFPMDADPYIEKPSRACHIHSAAGSVMMLTLLIAPLLSLVSPMFSLSFKLLTVVLLLLTIFFTLKLAKAYKNKRNAGLYQRLSYGCQLMWLSMLSLHLIYV